MAGRKNNDQRQIDFLKYYLDPKSDTFSDAKNSALRAGFSKKYAENITYLAPDWLGDAMGRRTRMLEKAERNLEEMLDVDILEQAMGAFGPIIDKKTKKPVMRRNPKIMALKQDTSKFLAETVGKKYYSKRTEMTGDNGSPLGISDEERRKIDAIFKENQKVPA